MAIISGPNGSATAAKKGDAPKSEGLVGDLGPAPTAGPQPAAGDIVKEGSSATFMADVVEMSQQIPVLVYFTAPWCEPCKQLGPALEKAVRQAGGLVRMVKINVDENQDIAAQLRVQSIPMVFAFSKGQPVDGFQGAVPDSQLKQFIQKLVGDATLPIEGALEEGRAALDVGDIDRAAEVFAQVLGEDSENAGAIAGLIRCATAQGDHESAHQIIEGLTPAMLKTADVTAAISALELAEAAGPAADLSELVAKVEASPKDMQARFDLAMGHYGAGQNESAIEALLEIIRRDRSWNDETARTQLLKIFEALGHTDPLTQEGRRQLSSVLFS